MILKPCNILNRSDEDKLTTLLTSENLEIVCYLTLGNLFNVIHKVHIIVGYDDRIRMTKNRVLKTKMLL